MDNDNTNQNVSIGCVMCASSFMYNDEETVVTTCGHLYHKKCVVQWLQSHQELNPTSRGTCPDCRTTINGARDVKPVYLHYTSPDDIAVDLMELIKEKQENKDLVRQLLESNVELKKLKMQLSTEKMKYGRLMVKKAKIEEKLASATNRCCSRCEAEPAKGRKIMTSKQRNRKSTVEAASNATDKVTKKLRSREYTYSL